MARKQLPDSSTDGRKQRPLVLWALGWRPDFLPIAEFIDAVEYGKPPPQDAMVKIAAAMRELFCHRDTDVSLRAVARKLGSRSKQGKRAITHREGTQAINATGKMLLRERELVAAGKSATMARTIAVRKTAAEQCVSLRTAQAWRKSYAAAVQSTLDTFEKLQARINARNKNPG